MARIDPPVWVIDTNVLLVADRRHPAVSDACVAACIERLIAIRQDGFVVLDDAWEIIGEYRHKTDADRGKTVAQVFLKWLLRNHGRWVTVHLEPHPLRVYLSFPADPDLVEFDPADRKFIAAAALAAAPVLEAADSKWLGWSPALLRHGIVVEFLCPEELHRFAVAKGLPIG